MKLTLCKQIKIFSTYSYYWFITVNNFKTDILHIAIIIYRIIVPSATFKTGRKRISRGKVYGNNSQEYRNEDQAVELLWFYELFYNFNTKDNEHDGLNKK